MGEGRLTGHRGVTEGVYGGQLLFWRVNYVVGGVGWGKQK